jgi:single-stranded-DNA-specific exonuclease
MTDWIEPQPVVVSDALRDAVGGHPLVATALARRGVITPEAARAFLNPDDYAPAHASSLPDMDLATGRIWRALTDGEHIAVWGDFDVDGQTSTALLVEALRELSAVAGPKQASRLSYRVPTRDQGHGIFLPDLDELLDRGMRLLVTCDTGVDAFAAIERAAERGCEVIVTDHHDLPDCLPPALAVVNPKRLPAGHPLCELPGVGVAYKLAERLYKWAGHNLEPDAALDLVALGVVADVATQVADVRYLLQRGLETLRTTTRIGLRALVSQAELRFDGLTEEHIGYQLAPRLNAVGRLGDANQGVELLLTHEVTQARILAAEMDGLNYERRLITNQITEAALTQIERDPSLLDYRALVIAGHKWHPGVLGLVAGRLAEQFQRPAVVLSIAGDEPARGSARSVPGCDIHAGIKRTANLLVRFGGHPGAAGVTLNPENLESFRKALSRSLEMVWDRAASSPSLQIDAFVPLDQLSLELVSELERLAPFGPGNPPLRLATCDLRIVEDALIGRESEHRRLVVVDEEGTRQTVLWWQGASQSLPEGRFDLAYALRARDYRGEMQLQVEWVDARIPGPVAELPSRPARTIVDWRTETNPQAMLAIILREEKIAVWVEDQQPGIVQEVGGADRLSLSRAPVLVIWTAPAGPVELAQTIQAVEPDTVYLIAAQPVTVGFRTFVEHLWGMLKHDLRMRDGQVNLHRLAAALGHRETTTKAGLKWLVAGGRISILETSGDILTVADGGVPSPDLQRVESRLRQMLEETAAYRRHFRTAPVEMLGLD